MTDEDQQEDRELTSEADPLQSAHWRDDALQWYLELKQDENVIAPWLSLEWTGDRMRVRR